MARSSPADGRCHRCASSSTPKTDSQRSGGGHFATTAVKFIVIHKSDCNHISGFDAIGTHTRFAQPVPVSLFVHSLIFRPIRLRTKCFIIPWRDGRKLDTRTYSRAHWQGLFNHRGQATSQRWSHGKALSDFVQAIQD